MKGYLKVNDWIRVLVVFIGAVGLLMAGCSDDEEGGGGTTGVGSGPITVEGILLNPKAPAPGDTMRMTAVVTGESAPGDFVQFAWTVDGGSFLESDQTTVRWVAPDTSQVFSVTVQARNSVSTSAFDATLFVSRLSSVVGSDAGEIRVTPQDDGIYFLWSSTPAGEQGYFIQGGSEIRRKDLPGGVSPVNNRNGFLYRFDPARENAVHVELSPNGVIAAWHDALLTGVSTELPTTPFSFRPPQFLLPHLSPDGTLVTYTGLLPDQQNFPAQGGVDTFRVFIYEVASQTAEQVTLNARNWTSSFSSDGNHLVFISDRGGSQQWELWSLPVQGGQVPVDTSVAATQLTSTGGAMAAGTAPPTVGWFEWNPDPADPILAIVDTGSKLRLVGTSGSEVLVNVAGEVADVTWARDGEKLAMIATSSEESTIYEVSKAGAATPLLSIPSADRVGSVAWSSDGDLLVYALTRAGSMWYEVMDVTGGAGLSVPVSITPALPRGNADDYAGFMSIRPEWEYGGRIVYLPFFDGATPRVIRVGLLGL